MTTAQQRAEERRREKLADVQRQIRDGSLVVRQMTAEERARFPPRLDRRAHGATPPRPKR
jgi:hypothetical protein